MKKTHISLLAGGLLASSMAMAEFSANMALTSDYVFRGFSQTEGEAAIQGGIDYSHANGFYAGVWASNVESDPAAPINYNGSNVEVDLYLGWGGDFNGFSVDVGALHYEYPGTNTSTNNTDEFHVGVGHDLGPASVSLTLNYSDDFFGLDEAYYWDLGVEIPVGEKFTAAAHYGVTDYDDDTMGDDYDDWSLGLSTEVGGFGLDLTYTDTSGVSGGCVNDTCDGRFIFTVSKEL